jgi:hypothetical protein
MTDDARRSPERRAVLRQGAALVVFGTALMIAAKARAAGSTPKSEVRYQYTPKGAARCGLCASFIPPTGAQGASGTCRIVAGPIPQNGWCELFSPASPN